MNNVMKSRTWIIEARFYVMVEFEVRRSNAITIESYLGGMGSRALIWKKQLSFSIYNQVGHSSCSCSAQNKWHPKLQNQNDSNGDEKIRKDVNNIDNAPILDSTSWSLVLVTVGDGVGASDVVSLTVGNFNNKELIPDLVTIEENVENNDHKKGILEMQTQNDGWKQVNPRKRQ